MKAREIQKVNSFLSLGLICRENIAIISMIPAMMANAKLLDKLLLELLSSAEEQAMPITHFAKEKMRVRKELAFLITEISGIIRSYALSVNNHTVKGKFSRGFSELCRLRAQSLHGHGITMNTFLDENFHCFRDFGLKKSKFDQFKMLHKNFYDLLVKPRTARTNRAVMTQLIPERIAIIESLVKDQMQTLLSGFSQFPEFCKAFKAARKQIKYGRPKEVLKNKIKKYRSAPALPRTRKSSKAILQLKPLKMPEMLLPEVISVEQPKT